MAACVKKAFLITAVAMTVALPLAWKSATADWLGPLLAR
jgi:hypothetical protein